MNEIYMQNGMETVSFMQYINNTKSLLRMKKNKASIRYVIQKLIRQKVLHKLHQKAINVKIYLQLHISSITMTA